MTVEVIGKDYKATLSHEDIRKIVNCVHMYGDFYYYTFIGEIEDLNDKIKKCCDNPLEQIESEITK